MSMGDGKAKNVLEYLDNLTEKGKATNGAIAPLKIAFTKVVQVVDGENWEETEVKNIDVEDYLSRFANLTMGKYTSDSLTAYKSRVNKAVSWYIQFLDKPGWTPDIQRRNRTPKAVATKETQKAVSMPVNDTSKSQQDSSQLISTIPNVPGRILYPYPLLDGQLIHVSLPIKLSKVDARRISAFIESIAIDTPTEGPSHE